MDINNIKSCIPHDEATVRSFMRNLAFADFILNNVINDGGVNEIRTVWRRICKTKARSIEHIAWLNLCIMQKKKA